jgi:hypothetical protein
MESELILLIFRLSVSSLNKQGIFVFFPVAMLGVVYEKVSNGDDPIASGSDPYEVPCVDSADRI